MLVGHPINYLPDSGVSTSIRQQYMHSSLHHVGLAKRSRDESLAGVLCKDTCVMVSRYIEEHIFTLDAASVSFYHQASS